ncbi:ArsR/SmtB family transcription factor [Actinomadura sp. 6N118]|uniref:ArsR/SmtB family transcription factor n=1 Tax=Actinomadura sp. 6N118 TaxID=3375151 RepID=UPI0037BA2BB2
MGGPERKVALYDQFARVGKALSNGMRLQLLDLIAQGERTVDSLARTAGLGLTTTSAHLQVLKRAGLVHTRRDGTRVYYSLAGDDVAMLYASIRDVAQQHIADTEHARLAYLGDETEAVSRDELMNRVREGTVIVLDVRPREEYKAGHIPGAISIPLEELSEHLSGLPSDREIVSYCRGSYCVLAHDAVRLLRGEGRVAARLADGMLEWRLSGQPVSTDARITA